MDHNEHDVSVLVTEQGLADLLGQSPTQRAKRVIEKCSHPDYRGELLDYYNRSAASAKGKHTPHILTESLSWHSRFLSTGSMHPSK